MFVLVDTSVWIRFLLDRAPYAARLQELVRVGDVVGHDLVFGELFIGDVSGRTKLLADYARMLQAPVVAHSEVVDLVRSRRLHGRGIGWIDVHLIASALVAGLKLWTVDPRLELVAEEIGIAYR